MQDTVTIEEPSSTISSSLPWPGLSTCLSKEESLTEQSSSLAPVPIISNAKNSKKVKAAVLKPKKENHEKVLQCDYCDQKFAVSDQ